MLNVLKPNLWKIILAAFLFLLSSALWRAYIVSHISDTFPRGFPFQYYLGWGPCPPGETCYEFNGLYLMLDLLIWYSISALVIARLKKR